MFIVQIFIVQIFIAQIFVAQIFVSKYLFPKYLKHSKCLLSKCVQTCGCRRLNLGNLQKFQQKSRFAPICIDLEFFHDLFAQATLTLCVLLSPQFIDSRPSSRFNAMFRGLFLFVCFASILSRFAHCWVRNSTGMNKEPVVCLFQNRQFQNPERL